MRLPDPRMLWDKIIKAKMRALDQMNELSVWETDLKQKAIWDKSRLALSKDLVLTAKEAEEAIKDLRSR